MPASEKHLHNKTRPPIEELREKKAKRVEEMTLHIYLPQQKKKSTPKRAKKV